ncbi:growth/differentiation factor 9 isoform X1 [Rhinoderma darwinii]|uniref:growth/differentiation factor 9 isoform X1 n=1 Tax=Rhinoderma darwinii TaxID=43563 RepID=UPI003F6690AE
MKKLYKVSATKEGVPRVHRNADYNTVRLFTPKTECKPGSKLETRGPLKPLDLTFNVDRVSVLEQNLQSVLLYYVNKQYSSSNITCICALEITDNELASPICPTVPHTFEFQLRNRQRWVEIDVTSFLQPFVSSRKIINLSLNLTCLWNKHHHVFEIMGPLQVTRSPPCLLLYLNDTSNKAYHRRKMHVEPVNWSSEHLLLHLNDLQEIIPATKVSRHRRGKDVEMNSPTVESMTYNFSKLFKEFVYHQNECELHKFRLSFSQLNWDKWILAPHRYSPDYCKGDCPRMVGHKYGSPVHTIVQNIIYEKVDSSIPRPSCIPSEYRPMSVLTIEPDNSIAYKEYEDMIATRCTCR